MMAASGLSLQRSVAVQASAATQASFAGLRRGNSPAVSRASTFASQTAFAKSAANVTCDGANTTLIVSFSTAALLTLGRFVFLPYQRSMVSRSIGRQLRSIAAASQALESAREQEARKPLVKMCGVTRPEDAAVAARAGAALIGMIMWPKSKRSVCVSMAREIAAAARENGAEPVGVFVDESAAEIESACQDATLAIAQLHGDGARASLLQGLPESLKVIYVLHANKNGVIQTLFPQGENGPLVDWVLVDSLQGGSGEQFDWRNFQAPSMESRNGWLLAGGLTPSNVGIALSLVTPDVVDVSSGIAGPDGILKDPARIYDFIKAVQNATMVANLG